MGLDKSIRIWLAQRSIGTYLQEIAADPATRVNAYQWGEQKLQNGRNVYLLIVYLDGSSGTIDFSEEELLDESRKDVLRQKIKDLLWQRK